MAEEQKKKGFSRRKFLIRSTIGVGVVLGVGIVTRPLQKRFLAGVANTIEVPYSGEGMEPRLWFEIKADNSILFHSPKVEMGQGTLTGLAQIAADELEVNMENMEVVHASSISGNVDLFSTGGSTSISSLWMPLRELAATMRQMMINETARIWGVEASSLKAESGKVKGSGQEITYGEIVALVQEWDVPSAPPLKEISEYRYVGRPVTRVDLEDKVLGAPIFGLDITLAGMLYGTVVRPTRIGAKFVDADTREAEQMPGVVRVVKEKDFVGVVAETWEQAERAKQAIQANWEVEREWDEQDIRDAVEVGQGDPVVIQKKGSAKRILKNEGGVITAEYRSPLGAHAQMEPNGALAYVEGDKATIHISTQVVEITRKEVASRLGIKKEDVNIVPAYLGGGFGRRLHTPHAIQTAVMSRAVGKPVKYFFTRKEEFQQDMFRPPTHNVLKAKLDENGRIKAIEHNISSGDVMYGSPLLPEFMQAALGSDVGAWRGGMIQYGAIPNYRAVSWRVKLPFATSWWRSLGLLANTFAIESFMDELAVAAGKNPVQFRLDQIQDDKAGFRLREVIQTAADKAGYTDEVINGRAMGFAASTDVNTPCAQVAEVSVENGEIKVHKVTCVLDPGVVINPDQVRAQCEGAIIMGMSASLFEEMTVKKSELWPTIYGPYRMALMKHAPREIDITLLENNDTPGGVGEPPLGPIGAAVANAVFRITGKRLREMPLKVG